MLRSSDSPAAAGASAFTFRLGLRVPVRTRRTVMPLPSHLLGALGALLGTVGSRGFAFGCAALAVELALEPLGAGVRLHRPLGRRAQLISQAIVLLAQA